MSYKCAINIFVKELHLFSQALAVLFWDSFLVVEICWLAYPEIRCLWVHISGAYIFSQNHSPHNLLACLFVLNRSHSKGLPNCIFSVNWICIDILKGNFVLNLHSGEASLILCTLSCETLGYSMGRRENRVLIFLLNHLVCLGLFNAWACVFKALTLMLAMQ